jgi:hypothetical protein
MLISFTLLMCAAGLGVSGTGKRQVIEAAGQAAFRSSPHAFACVTRYEPSDWRGEAFFLSTPTPHSTIPNNQEYQSFTVTAKHKYST